MENKEKSKCCGAEPVKDYSMRGKLMEFCSKCSEPFTPAEEKECEHNNTSPNPNGIANEICNDCGAKKYMKNQAIPYPSSDSMEKGIAYSPVVNKVRPILANYMNEWSNDMLCEIANLIKSEKALSEREAREGNKEALRELVSALHKEFIFTGLATEEQWNDGVAPRLRDLGLAIEGHSKGTPTARNYKYPHKSVWGLTNTRD